MIIRTVGGQLDVPKTDFYLLNFAFVSIFSTLVLYEYFKDSLNITRC